MTAILLLAALVAPTSAAGVSRPTVVVAGGVSTQRDRVTLLGGSHGVLVYELQPVLASDVGQASVPLSAPYRVVARRADGTTTTLTNSSGASALEHWSVAGQAVTAVRSTNPSRVAWWDLAARTSGEVALPTDGRYVSAAPGGVLSMTGDGRLTLETFAGASQAWSRPFGDTRPREVRAAVGPDGVVLGDDTGRARYVPFSHPGRVRALKTGGGAPIVCWAASSRYAACTTRGAAAGRPTGATLIALDGSAPTKVDQSGERFGPVALIGADQLVWERFAGGGSRGVLASITPHAKKPTVGTRNVAFGELQSAYGKAVTLPTAQDRLLQAANVTKVTTLAKAPRSPVTASSFALAAGRMLDSEDARTTGPPSPVVVRSRTVLEATSGTDLGAPHTVARPSRDAMPVSHVVVSGGRFGFETLASDGFRGTLHVVTPKRTIVIHRLVVASDVLLSGRWLAYDAYPPGGSARDLHVRNLVTGNDADYGAHGDALFNAAALADGNLVYATAAGRIVQVDLGAGHRTQLSAAIPQRDFNAIRIYAEAGRVGWEIWTGGDSNARYRDVIRDTDGSMIELHQHLVGLSPSGALLSSEPLQTFAFGRSAEATTLSLRAWTGTVTQVVSDVALGAAPQIADSAVAWLTAAGRLQMVSLP